MAEHRIRAGWIVAFAIAVSAFGGGQQPTTKPPNPERAALLARFDNPQDFLPRSGAGGTEWDANYRTFIQTDEAATSKGLPTHAAAAKQILADAAKGAANLERHLGFVLHIKHFSQAYRPDSATKDLRALYESLVDLKLGGKPPDTSAGPGKATGQDLAKTPRAAAVRYVRENGLAIPPRNVIVAFDTTFQNIDSKIQPFTQTELERDALEIAQIVSPAARTGKADAWLRCEASRCVPSTSTSVLVVNQPEKDAASSSTGVFVRLYVPGNCAAGTCATMSTVVVDVESQTAAGLAFATGWGQAICLSRYRNEPGPPRV